VAQGFVGHELRLIWINAVLGQAKSVTLLLFTGAEASVDQKCKNIRL